MSDWKRVADGLFVDGHDVATDGVYLGGQGQVAGATVQVIGTTGHADIGVEVALRMAADVLEVVRHHPGRGIVFLVDTTGQRLRRRDELLGLHAYVAHLAKCVELARRKGHRVVGLVYDQALSGGFLATAMMADFCASLPEAKIRVMGLPAMARVTRIPEERLRTLAASSPVFAPGAANYWVMGAVDEIWKGALGPLLADALSCPPGADLRAQVGLQRGGRVHAQRILQRVITA
jgi:malonate decarboxylase gamma subunit